MKFSVSLIQGTENNSSHKNKFNFNRYKNSIDDITFKENEPI